MLQMFPIDLKVVCYTRFTLINSGLGGCARHCTLSPSLRSHCKNLLGCGKYIKHFVCYDWTHFACSRRDDIFLEVKVFDFHVI